MSKLSTPVSYHCGSPAFTTGLKDAQVALIQNDIPLFAKGADNAGIVWESQVLAKQKPELPHGLVYRITGFEFLGGTDVPSYGHDPAAHAAAYWNEVERRWPRELDKDMVYTEFPNEVDKNQSQWLGELLYQVGLEAIRRGRMYCGPAWSGGEPEPEHWKHLEKYLRLCQEHRGRLAVSVHEYTFDKDTVLTSTEPWLIGRVYHLNAACAEMGIEPPDVFVTEGGWGANDAPEPVTGVPQLIDMLKMYIREYPNVRGFALWALDSSGQWKSLSRTINKYIEPLANAIIATEFPEKEGIEPPTQPAPSVIVNPSFELGWTDIEPSPDRLQEPDGWLLDVTLPGNEISGLNRATDEYPEATGTVEAKHLGPEISHVPPDEMPGAENSLFTDGIQVFKIQAVNMVSETDIGQAIGGLKPNTMYRISVDANVHYQDVLNEPDDVEVWLESGGNEVQYMAEDLPDRTWTKLSVDAPSTSAGNTYIIITFMTKWANSRDLFLDNVTIEEIGNVDPPAPPPSDKPNVRIVKLPQEYTTDEATDIFSHYWEPYKRTATASHDTVLHALDRDYASDESYAIVIDGWQPSQKHMIQELELHGYNYRIDVHKEEPVAPDPRIGLKLGRVLDYKYVKTNGGNFNDARSYGLHEGVDIDLVGGSADNPCHVLCMYDGVVDRVARTPGYGNQVRIKSYNNGAVFYHRYAHLEDGIDVEVGDDIAEGQAVGRIGNTGNSSGEHVHINLEVPGFGLHGYVVADVVDPWPFCYKGGYDLPPYIPQVKSYDLYSYIFPGADYGQMIEVRHPSGHTETFQTQAGKSTSFGREFFLVKNSQWEQFWIGAAMDGTEYIWRGIDTSPGPAPHYAERPNEYRLYKQYEHGMLAARWCPRYMNIGDVWNGAGHLVQFYYKSDCLKSAANSGGATNRMTLVAHHAALEFNGVVVNDVIELTNGTEHWYYAKGIGMVAWRMPSANAESSVIEILHGRPNLKRETVCLSN